MVCLNTLNLSRIDPRQAKIAAGFVDKCLTPESETIQMFLSENTTQNLKFLFDLIKQLTRVLEQLWPNRGALDDKTGIRLMPQGNE